MYVINLLYVSFCSSESKSLLFVYKLICKLIDLHIYAYWWVIRYCPKVGIKKLQVNHKLGPAVQGLEN